MGVGRNSIAGGHLTYNTRLLCDCSATCDMTFEFDCPFLPLTEYTVDAFSSETASMRLPTQNNVPHDEPRSLSVMPDAEYDRRNKSLSFSAGIVWSSCVPVDARLTTCRALLVGS